MPTRLTVERFAPAVFAVICGAAWWRLGGGVSGAIAKELLAAALSAAAICAGFLTTALSILLSLGGTDIGRRLKRRKVLPFLAAYLRSAIYSSLLVSLICTAAFFFLDPMGGLPNSVTSVAVTALSFAGAAIVRIVRILVRVMEQLTEEDAP